jgi:2-polyprenyl-3-methyl-5-hydroxy-6-metoxy-1,4-benzoquinol methylase
LRNPFRTLDKIYDVLTPGGLVVISTLDAESLVSRIIGKRLEDFRRTREHLVFFSRATLRDVLDEHGFDVLAIRSVGHTFELAFLLDRLALYNRPLFSSLRRLAQRLRLGSLQLHVNPRTKMIAIARRRAERRAAAASNGTAWSDLDRTLFEELQTLEAHNRRHYRWVFDVIAPYVGRSVLEVGSGIGVISQFLLTRCESLILSDYREIFLNELRRRFGDVPNVQFRLLDLDSRPYDVGNAEPDTVICMNVLEHIEDDVAALRALAAVIRPRGRLILQVPNYPRLFGTLDRSYGHFRRYSSRQLRAALDRAGFRVVALRSFGPFAIPGWILSGRVLRSGRLSPRALVAYDALVPIMRAFDFLSRLGGISLIAVAERKA